MTQVPGGWHADPTGRYEYRYWDGARWTDHVSRGGQTFVDPVTPAAPTATAATTEPAPTEPTAGLPGSEESTGTTAATDPGAASEPTNAPTGSPWAGAAAGAAAGLPSTAPTAPAPAGIFQAPAPPPAGPGSYGYLQYAPGPAQVTVAGLAIASMVLGILWIYWIGSILAIIFGHVALGQIKRSNGWKSGRGMAIAGLVLGYLGIAMLALVIIVAVATRNSNDGINSDRSDGFCNESRYLQDPDC